jgi:hypothetical protein
MAISIFPSTAAEFVSNNFVIDMNDTSNNTADTGGVKQAGPYVMSFSSGDSSFDVYLIDEDGNSVGYSNGTSISASGLFSTVVILGAATDEIVSFSYQGSINNADGEGDEPGAGAYLESITPSDLPSINDTATIIGGNFASDVEITFESGATVLSAKNIVIIDTNELLVTRPDGLVEDDAPYTLRAVNNGVPEPTGSDANLLVDEVTAGSDPTWVTTSPISLTPTNEAFSLTFEATDAEGTVVDYEVVSGTLPTGLSLERATGILSGTPTVEDTFTYTIRATDDGGNSTDKEFTQQVAVAIGGTITTDATHTYHTFTGAGNFELATSKEIEYLVIGGGGFGGSKGNQSGFGGGGGAGGLKNATVTKAAGTYAVTVGASGSPGTGSSFDDISVSGGGRGGQGGESAGVPTAGQSGGSGGGAGKGPINSGRGSGIAGQGNDGGNVGNRGGGGGGAVNAGSGGTGGNGGDGLLLQDWADATGIGNGVFAGGGDGEQIASDGAAGTGYGGQGRTSSTFVSLPGFDGSVIVRYAN